MKYFSTISLLLGAIVLVGCDQKPETTPPGFHEIVGQISTNRIVIGQPFKVEYQVGLSPDENLIPPVLDRDDTVVQIDREIEAADLSGESPSSRIEYTLTSFVVGEHSVSTGKVAVAGTNGTVELALPELLFRVESVLPENEELAPADVRDVRKLPALLDPKLRNLLYLLLGVVLLFAVIAFLLHKFWNPKEEKAKPPPLPPAEQEALAALSRLAGSRLESAPDFESFYMKISAIVRRYIERRFDLHAPERTTEEFMQEAGRSQHLSVEQRASLKVFLEQCDLVKFAQLIPASSDALALIGESEKFVRETTPNPRSQEDGE